MTSGQASRRVAPARLTRSPPALPRAKSWMASRSRPSRTSCTISGRVVGVERRRHERSPAALGKQANAVEAVCPRELPFPEAALEERVDGCRALVRQGSGAGAGEPLSRDDGRLLLRPVAVLPDE